MQKSTRIRLSRFDRGFNIVNTAFLTILMLIVFLPLLNVLASSFSNTAAVNTGKVWFWPVGFNLRGYITVFNYDQVMTGYLNSLIYTVGGTAVGVAMTFLAAYPLSRKDFFGRGVFMGLFTFTMLFSGGLIPSYLLNRSLGLLDSRLVMVIPGAVSVMNVIIARTFLVSNIPDELLDAAQIDGCNDFQFFMRIVTPLATTILAVLTLWYAVGHWNSYTTAIIYLRTPSKFPLQVVLRSILILSQTAEMMMDVSEAAEFAAMQDLIKYALIVVASVPMLLLYPFLQKYFVKGIMIGSLKG